MLTGANLRFSGFSEISLFSDQLRNFRIWSVYNKYYESNTKSDIYMFWYNFDTI